MRRVIAIGLLVLLAGCTGGSTDVGAIGRYVALPSDLPAEYEYVDIDSEDGEFLREVNMTENPGFADPEVFGAFDGVEKVYFAAYVNGNGSLILSVAIQFVDGNATQVAAQEFAEDLCGDQEEGIVYSQGAFMGTVATFTDERPDTIQASKEAGQRVMARTGAVDVCA